MQAGDAAFQKIAVHGAIGGEHELFDEAMRDVAFAANDADHAILRVEFDDAFGKIEVDGAVFVAARIQEQRELFHVAEMRRERLIALGGFGVAFEHFVDVGVRHALRRLDDAARHARAGHVAARVEFHQRAHDEAIFARLERTHSVGKRFGKHGDGAIGKINAGAAETRFVVERRCGADVVRDVGDVNLQTPCAVGFVLDVYGVVEVARGFAVDGDDGQMAEIFAALRVGFGDGLRERFGFVRDFGRKNVRQVMLANDDLDVYAEIAGAAENFDDAAGGGCAAARKFQNLDVDDGSVEFVDVGNARRAMFQSAIGGCAIAVGRWAGRRCGCRQAKFLRELRSQLIAGENLDRVLHARVVGEDIVAALTVAEEADHAGVGAVEYANDAAFGALGAGTRPGAQNFGEDVVAMHGVLDSIAGDKDVASVLGCGDVWDDEAVTVVMEDEAAG